MRVSTRRSRPGSISDRASNLGCALILILTILFFAAVVWVIDQNGKRRSAEVPVEIVEVKGIRWYDSSDEEYKTGYDVFYRYSVNGQVYETTSNHDESYKPGTAYKICYNPKNPRDHEIYQASHRCGDGIF